MTAPVNRREGGSVLMLVPAGFLVLLILGSIAVDSAVIFLAQRDLSNRTAAAANDIAAMAVDDAAFYDRGTVNLDQGLADDYVRLAFADDQRPEGFLDWAGSARTSGNSITVAGVAEVDLIFAKAIPGVAHVARVESRSVASLRDA